MAGRQLWLWLGSLQASNTWVTRCVCGVKQCWQTYCGQEEACLQNKKSKWPVPLVEMDVGCGMWDGGMDEGVVLLFE